MNIDVCSASDQKFAASESDFSLAEVCEILDEQVLKSGAAPAEQQNVVLFQFCMLEINEKYQWCP